MITQICLDMDGVLTNFIEPTVKLFGWEIIELLSTWERGAYDVCKALGVSENEFWAKIDKGGSKHWGDLPPYPWHKQLLTACQKLAPTIVLSSPSMRPGCASGKIYWLQTHYGKNFRDFLIGPRKHFCAKPGAVLIDDSDENCEKFKAAGGQTIVFPQWWNSQHAKAAEPIAFVAEQLQQLGVATTN